MAFFLMVFFLHWMDENGTGWMDERVPGSSTQADTLSDTILNLYHASINSHLAI